MLVELEYYNQEKEVHVQKLQEITETVADVVQRNKKIGEEVEKYKGQIRKYLPSALNTIKTIFQIEYSLYKIGKDYTVQFNVVETNVKKSRSEVLSEMEQFVQQTTTMNLSQDQVNKLNIAIDVLVTYTEDYGEADEYKAEKLSTTTASSSSILSNVSSNTTVIDPNTVQSEQQVNTHNPYAEQPLNQAPGFASSATYSRQLIDDPFANIQGTVPGGVVAQPVSGQPYIPEDNIAGASMAIFGVQSTVPDNASLSAAGIPVHTNAPQQQPAPVVVAPVQQQVVDNTPIGAPSVVAMPAPVEVPNQNIEMEYVCDNKFIQNTGVYVPKEKTNSDIISDIKPDKMNMLFKVVIGAIVMPLMAILIALAVAFGMTQYNVLKVLNVNGFSAYFAVVLAAIIVLCGLFSKLLMKLVRWITPYVGKFLILPTVIFAGVVLYAPEYFPKILNDVFGVTSLEDVALYLLFWMVWTLVSYWFVLVLFINAYLVYCDRPTSSKEDSPVRWNGIEKIAFLGIVYFFFIPAIQLFLGLLNMSNMLAEISGTLYGFDNWKEIISWSILGLAGLMIILNIVEDFKNLRMKFKTKK